jgi:trans-2,3-dihydro-3-hydroxyanthranilate isomerase
MHKKHFVVVNSFACVPYGGNPVAVFVDGSTIPDDEKQKIARQLNLVETVFSQKSECSEYDFELRYFTPREELPIAGHPTIGTFIALYYLKQLSLEGKRQTFKIKTKIGIQDIMVTEEAGKIFVSMNQIPPVFYPIITNPGTLVLALNLRLSDLVPDCPVQPVDTGLGHIIVPVNSKDALLKIKQDINTVKAICLENKVREIQAYYITNENKIMTRNICPREGLEDPACGVGNGALGAYLIKNVYKDKTEISMEVEQGMTVDMPSVIGIQAEKKKGKISVRIKGEGITMLEGNLII